VRVHSVGVFVGGITTGTTELELIQLFSDYGHVRQAKIITDKSGTSKGYAFITFETEEEAERVQASSDFIVFKERRLNIAPAILRQNNQPTCLRNEGQIYQTGISYPPNLQAQDYGVMAHQHHQQPNASRLDSAPQLVGAPSQEFDGSKYIYYQDIAPQPQAKTNKDIGSAWDPHQSHHHIHQAGSTDPAVGAVTAGGSDYLPADPGQARPVVPMAQAQQQHAGGIFYTVQIPPGGGAIGGQQQAPMLLPDMVMCHQQQPQPLQSPVAGGQSGVLMTNFNPPASIGSSGGVGGGQRQQETGHEGLQTYAQSNPPCGTEEQQQQPLQPTMLVASSHHHLQPQQPVLIEQRDPAATGLFSYVPLMPLYSLPAIPHHQHPQAAAPAGYTNNNLLVAGEGGISQMDPSGQHQSVVGQQMVRSAGTHASKTANSEEGDGCQTCIPFTPRDASDGVATSAETCSYNDDIPTPPSSSDLYYNSNPNHTGFHAQQPNTATAHQQFIFPAHLPPLTPITPSVDPALGSKTGYIVPHTPNMMTNSQFFHFAQVESPICNTRPAGNNCFAKPRSSEAGGDGLVKIRNSDSPKLRKASVSSADNSRLLQNTPFKRFHKYTGQPFVRCRFPMPSLPPRRFKSQPTYRSMGQHGGNSRGGLHYSPHHGDGGGAAGQNFPGVRFSSGAPAIGLAQRNGSLSKLDSPRFNAPPLRRPRKYSDSKGGFYKAGDKFGKKVQKDDGVPAVVGVVQQDGDGETSVQGEEIITVEAVVDELVQSPPPTPAKIAPVADTTTGLTDEPDLLQGKMKKLEI